MTNVYWYEIKMSSYRSGFSILKENSLSYNNGAIAQSHGHHSKKKMKPNEDQTYYLLRSTFWLKTATSCFEINFSNSKRKLLIPPFSQVQWTIVSACLSSVWKITNRIKTSMNLLFFINSHYTYKKTEYVLLCCSRVFSHFLYVFLEDRGWVSIPLYFLWNKI